MTYLTTRDVAALLGLRRTTNVVRLIESGQLPCANIRAAKGGRKLYRITLDELVSYLEVYAPTMVKKARERWSYRAA